MNVITDKIVSNAIAKQMKKVSQLHYLVFMYTLQTGMKLSHTLSVTANDAIDPNDTILIPVLDFLDSEQIIAIHELIKTKKENERVFDLGTGSEKRDIMEFEKTLVRCANDCFFHDNINSEVICNTFYYNFLRSNNYFFQPLRQLFFSRGIPIPSLPDFLRKIKMLDEEYLSDMNSQIFANMNEYKVICNNIIKCFSDIYELIDLTPENQDEIDVKIGTLHKVEAVYNIMNKLEFFN